MQNPLDITGEALAAYRQRWAAWLNLSQTTDAERELAATKIALIDTQLAS